MAEFGTGYYHPLDRDYGKSTVADASTNDIGVGVKDVGMSVPMGISAPNVQGLEVKTRAGMKSVEIAFPGAGTSRREGQTPGVYGQLQRQAIEEMARHRQIDLSTHAAYGIMGLAGQDQQGNFSKEHKKFAVDEIKRAIEFAADVAKGGNVVVHTGEFRRPLSEEEWARDPRAPEGYRFKSFAEEPEKAVIRVVDDRSGHITTEVRKDRRVARPVWLRAEKDYEGFDEEGNKVSIKKGDYIDYEDRKIAPENRVPGYDPEKGMFKVRYMGWEEFQEESKEMTERAKAFWRENRDKPREVWETSPWLRFREAKSEDEIVVRPEEAYVIATMETNAANARGWAYYYGAGFEEQVEHVKKFKRAMEFYKKLEEAIPEEEKWKIKKQLHIEHLDLVPPEEKYPTEILKVRIHEAETRMKHAKEASAAQWAMAQDTEENIRHITSARNYALKEAFGAYAEAGIKAMEETKRKNLERPVFVGMENIFPESYGSHPNEMMSLIEGGRKAMQEMLVKKGFSENEAKEKAETHIKAHLDTGHLNMWRKYWNDDPKKKPEQNDKDFRDWVLKKTEEMAKKNIIGSMHLTDNYGYQDDHLSPGEGTTPVREMVKIMKKHGYKGSLIVEPGADATTDLSDFHGLMKTWRLFGSQIYGIGAGMVAPARSRKWGEVQYGYFGQIEPPYFIFGRYSPSEDWTLWSGVPME